MPEIARFYGITVRMYPRDHAPPHVHVAYGEEYASVAIVDGTLLEGTLRPRVRRHVLDWMRLHREELDDNWRRVRSGQPPRSIASLK